LKKPVLVVGSVAFDDVETPFGKRFNALGGSAIFFSLAAAHFTKVNLVGVAGNDYPEEAIAMLHHHGIDTEGLEVADGLTFRWGGRYHNDINQRDTLYTHLNVFADFKPKIPVSYRQTRILFLGNIQPALQMEVLSQINPPELVVLDTMNLWIKTTNADLLKVIKQTDLLIINESELADLTGTTHLLKGLKNLHALGPHYIVIKRGEYGSLLSSPDGLFYTPAFAVEQAVDPTGAGDSYAGGLVGYLGTCEKIDITSLKKAVVYGSVLGSFCVENFSVDGLLNISRSKITARYRQLRQMVKL